MQLLLQPVIDEQHRRRRGHQGPRKPARVPPQQQQRHTRLGREVEGRYPYSQHHALLHPKLRRHDNAARERVKQQESEPEQPPHQHVDQRLEGPSGSKSSHGAGLNKG